MAGVSKPKTDLMIEMEKAVGEPIDIYLLRMLNTYGTVRTADFLGIGYKTLNRWMQKLRIQGNYVYTKR